VSGWEGRLDGICQSASTYDLVQAHAPPHHFDPQSTAATERFGSLGVSEIAEEKSKKTEAKLTAVSARKWR
jgi:hypothetical protein